MMIEKSPGKYTTLEWPNLTFTEKGAARLEEVESFLVSLGDKGESAKTQFQDRLRYLNEYGRNPDGSGRFDITLGSDWAPLSFSVSWYFADGRHFCSGALIWHGGSNDPLSVTLTDDLWAIHT